MQRQKDESARDASRDLAALLGQWRDEAAERLKRLQTQDLATLQQEQAALEKNLKDIARPLQELIGQAISKAREAGEDLKQSLEEDIRRFNKLSARQGSRTYTKSREVSTSKWYKPWTWGKTKTVYRTYTESYSFLSPADAVENVTRYERECARSIEQAFGGLLHPATLIGQLRKALADELAQRQDFDPAAFRHVMEQARHDFANQQQQARRYEALLAALQPLIAHSEKALAQG